MCLQKVLARSADYHVDPSLCWSPLRYPSGLFGQLEIFNSRPPDKSGLLKIIFPYFSTKTYKCGVSLLRGFFWSTLIARLFKLVGKKLLEFYAQKFHYLDLWSTTKNYWIISSYLWYISISYIRSSSRENMFSGYTTS